jgi:hypothetical protein
MSSALGEGKRRPEGAGLRTDSTTEPPLQIMQIIVIGALDRNATVLRVCAVRGSSTCAARPCWQLTVAVLCHVAPSTQHAELSSAQLSYAQ